jgi:hypothetical protein
MDQITFVLLGLFSLIIYMSTAIFFWAVFKENCSAYNNSFMGENNAEKAFGRSPYPLNPNFREYLRTNWKPLALSGLVTLGVFVFFITHSCDYA